MYVNWKEIEKESEFRRTIESEQHGIIILSRTVDIGGRDAWTDVSGRKVGPRGAEPTHYPASDHRITFLLPSLRSTDAVL